MDYKATILELKRNRKIYEAILSGLNREMYLWKPGPDKWCLLEVVCHLYDEEREDFRARTRHILENKTGAFTSIDPAGWVSERNYIDQNFDDILSDFLAERDRSIEWLITLKAPAWGNAYDHPSFGRLTAAMFLANWLAHDYLHFRQIVRTKFQFHEQKSGESLDYAGAW